VQQSKFEPPIGYIHISATNYHPANVYGGSEDEWVTFGSGRMIMGSDPQLPMTGGSEYITEAQLPNHHSTTFRYIQTSSGTQSVVHDHVAGAAYYPKYIQTYMWTKVVTSTTIIYSAGNAMGTVADLLDVSFPIGSVVARNSQVTTSYLFSQAQSQTWVQFAQGKTLVGQDSTDTAFDGVTPTSYIGEKSHTLTVAEMAPHTHTVDDNYRQLTTNGAIYHNDFSKRNTATTSGSAVDTTSSTGSGQAHNNVQPYEVVFYYKRTA